MDATLIAVIEMSQSSWLVAGIVPGVEREPLKKLAIDEHALLNLLNRWRAEAEKQGHQITRIAVAFEAGPDGFWLARWLAARGVALLRPATQSHRGLSPASTGPARTSQALSV
jgi:transposase